MKLVNEEKHIGSFFRNSECPEEYLLWFHHLLWTYKMSERTPSEKSDNTLWDELYCHYHKGVDDVKEMQKTWISLQGKIDEKHFNDVKMLIKI